MEDQQEQGGVIRGRGVCNQGEGVMDVDLEEGVAEVDVGLPVKQCVEWALGRGMRGILAGKASKKLTFRVIRPLVWQVRLLRSSRSESLGL